MMNPARAASPLPRSWVDVKVVSGEEMAAEIGLTFVTGKGKLAGHLGTLRNAEIKEGELF